MYSFSKFLIERKDRLIHGTTIDHLKSIKDNWLQPGTSEYTQELYGEEVPSVLFMASDQDIRRAFSSIRGQIGKKIKKHPVDVSADDIVQHGLLVVARAEDPYAVRRVNDDGTTNDLEDNEYYAEDLPLTAETGDYYTHEDLRPTGFLYGKRLVSFLRNKKIL